MTSPAAPPGAGPDPEVVRWFTKGLKIPTLIGKGPSGERIKGGPYRPGQLVAAGVVFVLGVQTMRWWGGLGVFDPGLFGYLQRWGVLAAVVAAAATAAKRVPTGTVSPMLLTTGTTRALLGGSRPVRAGRRVPSGSRRAPARTRVTVGPPTVSPPGQTPRAAAGLPPVLFDPQAYPAASEASPVTVRAGLGAGRSHLRGGPPADLPAPAAAAPPASPPPPAAPHPPARATTRVAELLAEGR